ncbi:MAG: amidohydrolase family protein [Burkholderiales bacterium]|nr:amidohydrolase family protein [Burkholderiales bacterium]
MNRLIFIFLLSAVHTVGAAAQRVPPELVRYADAVFYNGKVITVDKNFTVAEAVAVRDGKILAVGTNVQIRKLAGPSTRQLNLAGKSMVPGFIDSDADNAFAGGDLYKDTMVNGIVGKRVRDKSVPAMLAQVEQLVRQAKPGSPVYVRMADEFRNELSLLTAKDLDKIAADNPLLLSLSSSDGIANNKMLERAFAAGLNKNHFQVVKGADGRPTGQLSSQALGFIGWNLRDWPELTEEIFQEQEKIVDAFLRVGVTTVTGHGGGYTVTIISQMFHDGRLKMRIRPALDFARQNPIADQFLRRTPNLVNFGLGEGMVRIVGAAVGPVDGGSDDGGILTNEPKQRVPEGIGGTIHGANKWTGEQWTRKQWLSDLTDEQKRQTEWNTLQLFRKHGWNISGNHNMGSGASSIVTEALLDAEKQPDIKVRTMRGRNSLDHNLIWDAKSLALAKQLGNQMAYGLNSEIWSQRVVRGEEMLFAQYGEKMHTMQPVKDLLQAGLNVHIEGGNAKAYPLWRIERFVTRTDDSLRSKNSGRVWGKDQAIDRKQALRMVTINAAKFISEEAMLGSIEKGKYADLVVLSGDFLKVRDDQLDELRPVMTLVGGNVVYQEQ